MNGGSPTISFDQRIRAFGADYSKGESSMKFCKFGLFLALLVAVCLPVAAQTELRVNIPFNFIAAGKTLSAGQYAVRRVLPDGDAWGLMGDHDSAMVLISTTQSVSAPHPLSLVFLKQGDQYSLTRIWSSEYLGRDVLRPNVKQTVIAKSDSYVEVAAK
jgi:hypothetical protein